MIKRIIAKSKSIRRINRLKKLIQVNVKRDDIVRCGNDVYGGFDVAEDALKHRRPIIYSFGIGEDLSFSESALKRWDSDVFAFDPTPKAIKYVHNSGIEENKRFEFFEIGLSDEDGIGQFHLPSNELYVSGSLVGHSSVKKEHIDVVMNTLKTIMQKNGHNHIDVLKMDIEGSEFPVIEKLQSKDMRFNQLCVEVHDRFFEDGMRRLLKLFKKMEMGGYEIISISKNYEEYTFLRRDLI